MRILFRIVWLIVCKYCFSRIAALGFRDSRTLEFWTSRVIN